MDFTEAPTPSGRAQTSPYLDHPLLPFHLVLEGGAMRGLFTAGVLDYLLQQGILARRTIGVSAGALVGHNYVCGAMGRTAFINMKYCADRRYLSATNILLTGDALGIDFTFNRIPNELEHFEIDDIFSSPMKLTSVSSDLELGEADYHDIEPTDNTGLVGKNGIEVNANTAYMIASSAMPLASHCTFVDDKTLLDGGVCDSVPLMYSIMRGLTDGIDKHVVVLTQDSTFVKQPNKASALVAHRYAEYPYFVERFANRHHDYNRTYRMIKRMAAVGEIFVFQPSKPVEVSTLESDQDKLLDLYLEGYAQAAERFDALCHYLEID